MISLLGKRVAENVSINMKGSDIKDDMITAEQIIDTDTGELFVM